MGKRKFDFTRTTKETSIKISLRLDGAGQAEIGSGVGFLDHMLTLMAFWGRFDLQLSCQGDLDVDNHHSVEDIGLCLGQALDHCLEDKKGIARIGWAKVPMDEALSEVIMDLSGRPYLVYNDDILPPLIAGDEKDIWREFFKSVAFAAKMNLHIHYLYGKNGHHLVESAAKGFGIALAQAAAVAGQTIPSTKGKI